MGGARLALGTAWLLVRLAFFIDGEAHFKLALGSRSVRCTPPCSPASKIQVQVSKCGSGFRHFKAPHKPRLRWSARPQHLSLFCCSTSCAVSRACGTGQFKSNCQKVCHVLWVF